MTELEQLRASLAWAMGQVTRVATVYANGRLLCNYCYGPMNAGETRHTPACPYAAAMRLVEETKTEEPC